MSKYKYSDEEQQINDVLKYQDNELKKISFKPSEEFESRINESEEILRKLGIPLPDNTAPVKSVENKGLLVVPSWDDLVAEAQSVVGTGNVLEDIFTEEELKSNEEAIVLLRRDYSQINKLDKYDVIIAVVAGLLAAVVDILLVGIPQRSPEGLKAGPLADYVRGYFDKRFPEEEMSKLANSKVSKVPYDAQYNTRDGRDITKVNVKGLSTYYHRLLSLGHDPLLGLLIGVADIMNGTMTTIDTDGRIVSQVMEVYADRTESDIFKAIAKQITHFKSDITTSMGLPAPLMSLFNLLQFGSIGEEEQTIAEIVQGMYYEGYDFIHFCSQSVSVLLVEVITRIGYAIKRIKEGYTTKESIPFSVSREKHPKLATMLFLSHLIATTANAGKIYFTQSPLAINYPEWLAFLRYTYSQLKWVLIEKPSLRDDYVNGIINEELSDVFVSVDETFTDFAKGYIVVMT